MVKNSQKNNRGKFKTKMHRISQFKASKTKISDHCLAVRMQTRM